MYTDTQDCEGTAPAMAATGASIVQLSTRSPLDSTVQTENANGGDWQEELYEKIKSVKEMYFSGLNDLCQKIAYRVQQDPLHQRLSNEQIEKLKIFKLALERILCFLRLNKHDLQLIHKEKLLAVEKHINFFLSPDRLQKPTSSPLQEQLPLSSMQLQQPESLDGRINPPMQPVQGSMETPLDSTSQKGNTNGADWQEEVYHKIKSMKQMYFSKLNDLYQKIAREVQRDPLHQRFSNEQIEKLKVFKMALECILHFLGLNKHDLQLIHKEKLLAVEKLIHLFLYPDRLREPTTSPLQEQLPQSSMQLQQPQSLDGQINPPMQPVQGSMEAPLDSTSQKGNTNGADWQEEVYHKINSLKEMYFLKLNDLYQKIAREVQRDPLHQRLSNEQIEKLKMFKMALERILCFLGLNKHDIQLTHKEKLLSVEKHINFFLYPPRKPTTSPPLEQLRQSSMQFQQPQSLDGQTNPSKQPIQRSMVVMWQNNLTNLRHNSLSGVLQVATGSLQQNPVNSQQVNISSQSGMNPVQANLDSLRQNSNVLQQSLPEQHEQQLLQNQQLRQQYPHWQMQQQLFQGQQLMRQQQMLQNQQLRQQYHHRQMQQQLFQRQKLRRQQKMLQIQQLRRQYHQPQMQQQLFQRQQLRRQRQLFQRQQLRRQQQMLRNQHLRQQYHLWQMQQLLFQRQQLMQQQTTLLPTHQMSQASTVFHAASATRVS